MSRPERSMTMAGGRGIATLGLVAIWLLATSLLMLYVNRALVFEQRSAMNVARSSAAFEAAEAGATWALAVLNDPAPRDAQCEAATGPGPVRPRLLQSDPLTQRFTPGPAEAACRTRRPAHWECRCPEQGKPAWPGHDIAAAAFVVRTGAVNRANVFGLEVTGCSNTAGACDAASQMDAVAHVSMQVLAVPVLPRPPASAIAAGADIRLDSGAKVVNADVDSGGMTLHAGGAAAVSADAAVISVPGRPPAASVWAADADLRQGDPGAVLLERSHAALRDLPGTQTLFCTPGCTADELQASMHNVAAALHVPGPVQLELRDDTTLGSPTAPVLLIVDGPLVLTGAGHAFGLFVAESIQWHHTGSTTGRVDGALLAEQRIDLAGPVQIVYDADVLKALAALRILVRVPDSWNDQAMP